MKRLFILVGFVLAGCQTGQVTETAGAARLSTPADFATLYGQRLTFGDSDFVTINANGTLSGKACPMRQAFFVLTHDPGLDAQGGITGQALGKPH